jgi:carotenoid cleavage dioxygenase
MQVANRSPVAVESTVTHLEIEGRIPRGLAGTLFRNGPNPVRPDPAMHWFFGNGMVHAFRVQDGAVSYRNRWVRTRFWADAAGVAGEGLPDGVANTSVVHHAGSLLALEEMHMPVALDPASLATLGTGDFGGVLPAGPFTAHPKACPVTGNLVFFGYGADGVFSDAIRLGEIGPGGALLRHGRVRAPYAAMIHDFAVTARFIAIPLFPLVLDLSRGGYAWDPGRGSFLGVIDRTKGLESLRWLPVESGFAFHVANAWDQGGRLFIDLMLSDAPPLFPGTESLPEGATSAFLTRWEIDPDAAAPQVRATRLSGREGEFPRLDDRRAGLHNRALFWTTGRAICARDDVTGDETGFAVPAGDGASEPVFVADGEAEGAGWILSVLYRGATGTSDLAILDAGDLGAGPVALARLPVRVPDGFHGAWLGAAS